MGLDVNVDLELSVIQLDYVDFASFLQLVVFMQNIGGFLF
jgi:hypothetical protein